MCPHCGHQLNHPLQDGFTTCQHCDRCFDSSNFNRLLSAFWLAKRRHYSDESQLQDAGFSDTESILVMAFLDADYSHQEFLHALDEIGVSKVYVPKID